MPHLPAVTLGRVSCAIAALVVMPSCQSGSRQSGDRDAVFYRHHPIGSEAGWNPLRSGLQYVLDGAQLERSGTDDFDGKLRSVLRHLGSPGHTIEHEEGGWREFVNAEIAPVPGENFGAHRAVLPNLALHTLGGGMLYRKNAEWLAAHDVPFPELTAMTLAMATEVLGEATEKPETDASDEIADVLLFRPLGIWIFSNPDCARWVHDELGLVDWPYLLMWSVDDEDFTNVGTNYCVRPTWFASESTRAFAHIGLCNLFGLSHRLASGDSFSWGLGTSTVTVDPVDLRFSAGVFVDRDDSLLASLIVNGTEGYRARLNLYPGVLLGEDSPLGLFAGIDDDGRFTAGVQFELPIGLSR